MHMMISFLHIFSAPLHIMYQKQEKIFLSLKVLSQQLIYLLVFLNLYFLNCVLLRLLLLFCHSFLTPFSFPHIILHFFYFINANIIICTKQPKRAKMEPTPNCPLINCNSKSNTIICKCCISIISAISIIFC